MFDDYYRAKRVLVTGHTGFKGSWLTLWLARLGAEVTGYSDSARTDPSMFEACRLWENVHHVDGRLDDYDHLVDTIRRWQPEVIFHLAAQAIVGIARDAPRETFSSNVLGTVNVLDAAAASDALKAVVAITSDKCYENREWIWGYRENDELGGDDPYSLSKAAAELVIRAYQGQSPELSVAIASARSGNVLGGGDWSPGRLVPDIVRALSAGQDLVLRRPSARRPWQHVLEPLSGYLWLGRALASGDERYRSAWNFGPPPTAAVTVEEIVRSMVCAWGAEVPVHVSEHPYHETHLLRLDSEKSRQLLGWSPVWDIDDTVAATVDWYKIFYASADASRLTGETEAQIDRYADAAKRMEVRWAV